MRPQSVGTILNNTTKTTIFTVPVGYYAKWNLGYVVNHSGNNKKIDLVWFDKSENKEFYVLDQYVMSPSTFVKFDGGAYVVLEEGDEVKAQAEATSTFHLINTFELIRK
jgi:hypothetical protein